MALIILLGVALVGLSTLRHQVTWLQPPDVYGKDFTQDYLLARAVLDHSDPYVPLTSLAAHYLPAALPSSYHSVGGYPPFTAVLVAPLGLVDYQLAATIWLLMELALLPVTLFLIGRSQEQRYSVGQILVASSLLLLWYPVTAELQFGQLTMFLVALLAAAWVCYRSGRTRLAGVFLGLATAIKLMPAVVVLYFALKRRWSVVFWAAGAFAATTFGLATVILGPNVIARYLVTGLIAAARWRAAYGNYSATGIIWHLFSGTFEFTATVPFIAPVFGARWLALPLSILLTVAVLAVAIRAIARSNDPDVEYALAICTMLVVSPVTWQCYFVLFLWPLWVIGQRLHHRNWPVEATNVYVAIVILLGTPVTIVGLVAMGLGYLTHDSSALLAGLPLMLLPIGPLLLFRLLIAELGTARDDAQSYLAKSAG